ncbi:MAG: acyl-CoA reductase [Elusimicrobiota bacterium]
MLLASNKRIAYLVGKSDRGINVQPLVPYDELVCEFLNSLSSTLLSDKAAKLYSDVMAFAYWCRKANIAKLKHEFAEAHIRLGLGMVFHIAPSNVPINFAFSYVFSLLAGNANVVRVPVRDFPQTGIVCGAINRLLANIKYKNIADMTVFVRYQQDDEITGIFSKKCNARIIWGGDQAIINIRKLPIPERSMEIAFADRYSFCAIDADSVLRVDNTTLNRLAGSFYSDTYLMDQNACSSPHLVVWLGEGAVVKEAKEKFWNSVYGVTAAKYELQPVNAVDKYVLLCENAIKLSGITNFKKYGNYLYRVELDSLPANMDAFRGQYGFFYEYHAQNLNGIAHIINTKYQTLTYFGLEKAQLLDFVVKNRLSGIDRIVPIGSALDIGVIWDGYDIVRSLSRIIDFK